MPINAENSEGQLQSFAAVNLTSTGDFAHRATGLLKKRFLASLHKIKLSFWLVVAAPTLISLVYFGVLASDIYVSESRFVIRSPSQPQKSGLGLLLGGVGFSNAGEELQAAQGYIESRDALKGLNVDGYAAQAWSRDEVSHIDRFNPFGLNGSSEDLYKFYKTKVSARYDPKTGIVTLNVRAFRPEDANRLNSKLLQQTEALINRLNDRGAEDLVKYAQRELDESRKAAVDASAELAKYRDAKRIIDPERQATVQLQMISKLQDELIGARMQLLQLTSAAKQNPQIPFLRVRIAGLEQAINQQISDIAGSDNSLSKAAAEFRQLQAQSEFAEKQLVLASAALQEARADARKQRAYLERIAQPSLPDDAVEPRRLRGVASTFVVALITWGILMMLIAGVREHQE
jgi:capsular polysaccharide transport system permease protein